MDVIDLHCDALGREARLLASGSTYDFLNNDLHVDLNKLKRGNYLLQCFAVFVNPELFSDPLKKAVEEIGYFYDLMEKYPEKIAPVTNFADIEKNKNAGKISALLTVEGGECCAGSLTVLRQFYRMGVRLLTLTWNGENEIAYPNIVPSLASAKSECRPDDVHGLKPLGFEFLAEMENLGMIADVSHLSDAGFWDVCRAAKRPFVASHSNARALSSHVRNLTDDMLKALADRGGVAGINYNPPFLDDNDSRESVDGSLEQMTRHIAHMKKVAGIDVIALGSDFDGIQTNPALPDCGFMPRLADHLLSNGFTSTEVEKIFHGNALRILREFL